MKVITAYPIIMDGKTVGNKAYNTTLDYSSAEGDPKIYQMLNAAQTKAFQKYANVKGISPKLTEDGLKGAKTAAAWKIYGDDFYKGAMGITSAIQTATTIPATDTSAANQDKMQKLGYYFDKAKGAYVKLKETGLFDGLLQKLGLAQPTTDAGMPIIEEEKKGMSNTTKILIGVGAGILVIGLIVLATRPKTKAA